MNFAWRDFSSGHKINTGGGQARRSPDARLLALLTLCVVSARPHWQDKQFSGDHLTPAPSTLPAFLKSFYRWSPIKTVQWAPPEWISKDSVEWHWSWHARGPGDSSIIGLQAKTVCFSCSHPHHVLHGHYFLSRWLSFCQLYVAPPTRSITRVTGVTGVTLLLVTTVRVEVGV